MNYFTFAHDYVFFRHKVIAASVAKFVITLEKSKSEVLDEPLKKSKNSLEKLENDRKPCTF